MLTWENPFIVRCTARLLLSAVCVCLLVKTSASKDAKSEVASRGASPGALAVAKLKAANRSPVNSLARKTNKRTHVSCLAKLPGVSGPVRAVVLVPANSMDAKRIVLLSVKSPASNQSKQMGFINRKEWDCAKRLASNPVRKLAKAATLARPVVKLFVNGTANSNVNWKDNPGTRYHLSPVNSGANIPVNMESKEKHSFRVGKRRYPSMSFYRLVS